MSNYLVKYEDMVLSRPALIRAVISPNIPELAKAPDNHVLGVALRQTNREAMVGLVDAYIVDHDFEALDPTEPNNLEELDNLLDDEFMALLINKIEADEQAEREALENMLDRALVEGFRRGVAAASASGKLDVDIDAAVSQSSFIHRSINSSLQQKLLSIKATSMAL
ncbi:hypothetical protein A3195_00040 [Candidatus Thiodiazotropha endoloripes]|uniref:hypothetical protein n=1 Tax=Candidatus Thiodiazotropha endoloripes TaxID=1818881 RepID=UPI00083D5072|nr:hypothetical protein [Candidatus Thiodiazotropha endoloripes]ODB87703.1 hypothetical protein A3193_02015 [Candidatus Thiodiazotropha endoloripes]ODB89943.1 hypothetical protein A3195_00040 [Candidatus Thiodiazotropha endoloripes]